MSIISLVLGITSFVLSLIPVVGLVAVVFVLISIILGIISLVKKPKEPEKKQSKGPAIAGIVLSIVSIIVMAAWCFVIYSFISYFYNYEDSFTEMLESDTVIEENVDTNKEIESYKDEIRENLE